MKYVRYVFQKYPLPAGSIELMRQTKFRVQSVFPAGYSYRMAKEFGLLEVA
jgi:hypothetical protein